jgi:protein-S-isoprenylcysteine O-methyltransferase Ste14
MQSLRLRLESTDLTGFAGAIIMALFAATSLWRFIATQSLFFALLFFRDLLVSIFLCTRKPATSKGPVWTQGLAYFSSFLPLLYSAPKGVDLPLKITLGANLLVIAGFLLVTLATIELGNRMGVSPALRGSTCRTGVYRWMKHPMYFGYVIAELSWVLIDPKNLTLYCTSTCAYLIRANLETKTIDLTLSTLVGPNLTT